VKLPIQNAAGYNRRMSGASEVKNAIVNGSLDGAVGTLTVTPDREAVFDYLDG
jgi:hypothetical protein